MGPTRPWLSQPQGWGCPFRLLTTCVLSSGLDRGIALLIPARSSRKRSLCAWAVGPLPGPARPLWVLRVFCDDTVIPQRCCPAWGMLRAIAESVETQPLLRVSLAVLTIGSLLVIAVINLVGAVAGAGGPGQHPSG